MQDGHVNLESIFSLKVNFEIVNTFMQLKNSRVNAFLRANSFLGAKRPIARAKKRALIRASFKAKLNGKS